MLDKTLPFPWQMLFDIGISRLGSPDHIRSQKSRYDGYSDHDRVQKITGHVHRHAQAGDNKSELPDLRQTKSRLQSRLQRLTGQYHSQGTEYRLSDQNGKRNNHNRPDILGDHPRIDHHPH